VRAVVVEKWSPQWGQRSKRFSGKGRAERNGA
jgi:hypothetical protein